MSLEVFVVGKTNQSEIYVASLERPFIVDEYLIIQDKLNNEPVGEVTETSSYKGIMDNVFPLESALMNDLKQLNMIDKDKIVYMGKVRILEELQTPITPGATVRIPDFSEIEHLLMNKNPKKSLILGVIKGTEDLQKKLPADLSNIAPLYDANSKKMLPQQGIPFVLDHYMFKEYPHIGLFGGSGSGKTFGLRVMCEEIMIKGIPGIALDPHYELNFNYPMDGLSKEHQYSFANKHEIFQIGHNVGIKFTDITSEELGSLLEFIGDISQPMKGAINELFEKGDSFLTLFKRVQDLKQAFDNFLKPLREQEELPEYVVMLYQKHRNTVSSVATLQAISWRLDQLNKTGIFNCDISLVEACLMKRKLAIVRGKPFMLKMVSSYLIGKLYKKRRFYKDWEQSNLGGDKYDEPPKFPPFFIIMDECHHFAPNSMSENPIKRLLREISQEARKYGVFQIFGTQRPSLLDTTITAQLNTKIIFRTGIEADMNMIKTETNLTDEQVKRLPNLTSGNAFVSSAILRKTLYVRFRSTKTSSPHSDHPFDELDAYGGNDKLKKILEHYLPLDIKKISEVHSSINTEMEKSIALSEIQETLEEMVAENTARKEVSCFGEKYYPL